MKRDEEWTLKINYNHRCARVLAGRLMAMSLPARTRAHRLGATGCTGFSKTIIRHYVAFFGGDKNEDKKDDHRGGFCGRVMRRGRALSRQRESFPGAGVRRSQGHSLQ